MKLRALISSLFFIISPIKYDKDDFAAKIVTSDNNSVGVAIYAEKCQTYVFAADSLLFEFIGGNREPYIYRFNLDIFKSNHLKLTIRNVNNIGYLEILYHDKCEVISKNNNLIYNRFYLVGTNVKIIIPNKKYIEFAYYENYYEINNLYIDISKIYQINTNESKLDIKDINLIIKLDLGSYRYLKYDDNYMGYVFPLDYIIEDNHLKIFLKDKYYYGIGTFQMAKYQYNNFLSTEKIFIPKIYFNNSFIVNLYIELGNYRIYYSIDVFYNELIRYLDIDVEEEEVLSDYESELIIK